MTSGAGFLGANTDVGVAALSGQVNSNGKAITTGGNNTAVGSGALQFGSTGSDNTAVGYQSLQQNRASDNTAVGNSALQQNTTGQYDNAFGEFALQSNETVSSNTALSKGSLFERNRERQHRVWC